MVVITIIIIVLIIIVIITFIRHLSITHPPLPCLPTDAGGESPLLLLSALIDKTADVFFSQRTTVVGDIEGWAQRKKNPESHEESFDENERFLDV